MERPDWCQVGEYFEWKAKHITGCDSVREEIIGYTDNGFLHTAHCCPVYETLFNELNDGRFVKEG